MESEASGMFAVIKRSNRFRFDGEPITWAVGITTSPRERPTIERCIESVKRSGFEPEVFDDVDSSLGRMGNWIRTMEQLLRSDRNTIMIVQDDCVFSQNVRGFLEMDLWPDELTGLVSVYNCGHSDFEKTEEYGCVEIQRRVLCGAVTFIFPRHVAEAMVNDREWVTGLASDSSIDLTVGIKTKIMGYNRYYYKPSMAQHIGLYSTSSRGLSRFSSRRTSLTFPGEDACVIEEYGKLGYLECTNLSNKP